MAGFTYHTYWIRNEDQGAVAAAVDQHLAGKPPGSIVAVNFTQIDYGGKIITSGFVTIRYE